MSRARKRIEDAVRRGTALNRLRTLFDRLEEEEYRDVGRSLMFLAASRGRDYAVEWLANDIRTPLTVTNEAKQTILHIAVEAEEYNLVAWLMGMGFSGDDNDRDFRLWNGSMLAMYQMTDANGYTPLALAASRESTPMIERMLHEGLFWGLPRMVELNRRARDILGAKISDLSESAGPFSVLEAGLDRPWNESGVDEDMESPLQRLKLHLLDLRQTQELLLVELRASQVENFLIGNSDTLELVQRKVETFDWWPLKTDRIEWQSREQIWLHRTLERCAENAQFSILIWILDTWRIEFTSPVALNHQGFSVPDYVACGRIRNYVKYEKDWMLGDGELNWLERGRIEMLLERWDGNDIDSLTKQIASQENPEMLMASPQRKVDWYMRKLQGDAGSHVDARLQIIQLLMSRYKFAGIPRLDLLVMAGCTGVLKWLIERNHVNLSAGVIDPETEGDDQCSVCLGNFRRPVELSCGHSLCRPCARDLFDANRTRGLLSFTSCPLCRAQIQAPDIQPGDVVGMLMFCSREHYPWLKKVVSDDMSVGLLLVALSAGMGSLSVLMLLKSMNVDLFHVFQSGRNLMHIAASRKQYLVVRWLGENGYLGLVGKLSNDGLTPLIEATRAGDTNSASYLLECEGLDASDVNGHEWLQHALRSEHKSMRDMAKEHHNRYTQWVKLPQLIESNASFAYIAAEIDSLDMQRLFQQEIWLKKPFFPYFICDVVIRHGRVDVLRYLCTRNYYFPFQLSHHMAHTRKESKTNEDVWKEAVMKHRANPENFANLFSEMRQVERVFSQCLHLNQRVSKLIETGSEVHLIEEAIVALDQTRESVTSDFKSWFEYLRFGLQTMVTNGLKPLLYVATHGYVHLVDWLLNIKHQGDIAEATSAIFTAISAGKLNVVQFLVNWFATKSIDINNLRLDEEDTESETIFDMSARNYYYFGCFLKSPKVPVEDRWAIVEWLASRPEVRLGSISAALDNIDLERYSSIFTGESIIKLVKLYVEKDADYSEIDSSGRSIVQRLIDAGDMESVEWLAIDVDVDIQDLVLLDVDIEAFESQNIRNRLIQLQSDQRERRSYYELFEL